jgi:hypothetical protein
MNCTTSLHQLCHVTISGKQSMLCQQTCKFVHIEHMLLCSKMWSSTEHVGLQGITTPRTSSAVPQLSFTFVLAGSVWVNMYNVLDSRMPFGGYKV